YVPFYFAHNRSRNLPNLVSREHCSLFLLRIHDLSFLGPNRGVVLTSLHHPSPTSSTPAARARRRELVAGSSSAHRFTFPGPPSPRTNGKRPAHLGGHQDLQRALAQERRHPQV